MGQIAAKKVAVIALAFIALVTLAIAAGTIADAHTATQYADGAPLMYAGVRG